METNITLSELSLTARTSVDLPRGTRVIYVRRGEAHVEFPGGSMRLGADSAWISNDAIHVAGDGELWVWRLSVSVSAESGGKCIVSHVLTTAGPEVVLRCDRLDFPLSGIAYAHTHTSPGLRRVLQGSLRCSALGRTFVVGPGDTWFERGPDEMYAETSDSVETAFVRVMVLAPGQEGKKTIRHIRPDEVDPVRGPRYHRLVESALTLDAF